MRKLILKWLFGTDDIEKYMKLLEDNMDYGNRLLTTLDDHLDTLKREEETIDIARKLIKICKNHGIDIDEEAKHIEL